MSRGNSSTIEYGIVSGSTIDKLEKRVQGYINEGWELVGGVSCDGFRYIQAMTKRWGSK